MFKLSNFLFLVNRMDVLRYPFAIDRDNQTLFPNTPICFEEKNRNFKTYKKMFI